MLVLVYANILPSETCPPLTLMNGTLQYNLRPVNGRYLLHTVARHTCDPEFSRIGALRRTCNSSSVWDKKPPACQDITGQEQFFQSHSSARFCFEIKWKF